MNILPTALEGVVILEPKLYHDERGYFTETYSQQLFARQVCPAPFVQDNESLSRRGVIRGLHYQVGTHAQGKLVRVAVGCVRDVAVDLRRGSPTFGQHIVVELSADNHRQLFIPRGFAHGFEVLSSEALLLYKCDHAYAPESERTIAWDDPTLGIEWMTPREQVCISSKDQAGCQLADARDLFDYTTNYYAEL